jgi:hypothetical protein
MLAPRRFVLVLTLMLSLGAALAPAAARAAVNPLGAPFRVDAGEACGEERPDVAPLPGGGFVAVWEDAGEVLARRFDAAGRPLGKEIAVGAGGGEGGAAPKVDAHPDGRFVVAWRSGAGLQARRFDAAGAPLAAPFEVTGQVADGFDVAVREDGPIELVWSTGDIWKRSYWADGVPLGPPVRIRATGGVTGSDPRLGDPVIASRIGDGYSLVWQFEDLGIFRSASVAGAVLRLDETVPIPIPTPVPPVFELIPLALTTRSFAREPALAAGPQRGLVVAWREEEADGTPRGVFLQRFDVPGHPFDVPVRVDEGEWSALSSPAVAVDELGNAIVAWAGTRAGVDEEAGVFARAVHLSVLPLGPAVRLSARADGPAGHPALAAVGERSLVALWQEGAAAGGACASGGIRGQRLAATCGADTGRLCLLGGRFQVEVSWEDPLRGTSGEGQAFSLTDQSGYFWFFSPENVELMVKLVDGSLVNGRVWVFYGALSHVPYTIVVTDTATGQRRTYDNPAFQLASRADTDAFPTQIPQGPPGLAAATATASPVEVPGGAATPSAAAGAGASRLVPVHAAAISPCNFPPFPPAEASTGLCLGGQFEVEVEWRDPVRGTTGQAHGVPLSEDSGYFWFFSPGHVELVAKVLDGRPVNGRFWFFSGALTHVEYTITVRHVATGVERTYHNPPFQLKSFADTDAFLLPDEP